MRQYGFHPDCRATTGSVSASASFVATSSAYSIAPVIASKAEGDASGTAFSFTVTRIGSTSSSSSVNWAVKGFGANPANSADFVGGALPTGTTFFSAGQTSQTVTINVAGDTAFEPDEQFSVAVANAFGELMITTGPGVATISNDDSHEIESVGTTRLVQVGNNYYLRDVTGAGPSLRYDTGIVVAGQFGAAIPIGAEAVAGGYQVAWRVVGADQFVVWNTDSNGKYTSGATAVVPGSNASFQALEPVFQQDLNGDGRIGLPPPPTQLSIVALDANKTEGSAGATTFTFTVTRSGDISGKSNAIYNVSGSGLRPADAADFLGGTFPSGSVSFLPSEISKTISVDVAGDATTEGNETFSVTLASPSAGVAFGLATAIGMIGADDTIVDLAVVNSATGMPVATAPTFYDGPVAGLEKEFILLTPDNLNVSANGDDWFIHSGSGTDGLAAHGGRNVLDGGTGSNFLTGASGEDTFFLDARGATSDIWSTVVGFGKGDSATVWGVSKADFTITWQDGLGAPDFTGLTMQAMAPGKPNALLTLVGYSKADIDSGKVVIAFGAIDPSTPYLYVYGAS